MSTAIEVAIRANEHRAQLAPVIALINAGMQPLIKRTTFMAWDATLPTNDKQYAVLRSMSPRVKRLLTMEKRWREWDGFEVRYE